MNPLEILSEMWGSHKPVSRKRKVAALCIGGATDILEIAIFPLFWQGGVSPFDLALDLLTAGILWGVLGFRWRLFLAFILEMVPGLTLFPTWTALVLSIPGEYGEGEGEPPPMKNVTPPRAEEPAVPALPEPPRDSGGNDHLEVKSE